MTYLTFALNYHFAALRTWGYHAVNVLLHVLNVALLFFLTEETPDFGPPGKESLGFFHGRSPRCSRWHPINTIDVSYVFSIAPANSRPFSISPPSCYLSGRVKGARTRSAASLACFVLAIFSKQDAITLPAILLGRHRFHLLKLDIQGIAPEREPSTTFHFWIVLGGYIAFRYFYLGGLGRIFEAGMHKPSSPGRGFSMWRWNLMSC